MFMLRSLLREWAVPVAIGVPLAALILWLGDTGTLLYLTLTALFAGFAVWVLGEGQPRRVRTVGSLGVAVFAWVWPPSFYVLVEGVPLREDWLLAARLIAISPAAGGLTALAFAWRRTPKRSALGYGLVSLGLGMLLPLPWMSGFGVWVLGGLAMLVTLVGSRVSPTPPLGDLERSFGRGGRDSGDP